MLSLCQTTKDRRTLPHPTGTDIRIDLKRIEAVRLRASGSTYREIAAEMDCSLAYAYQLVHDRIAQVKAEATEDTDEARAVELERLDANDTEAGRETRTAT